MKVLELAMLKSVRRGRQMGRSNKRVERARLTVNVLAAVGGPRRSRAALGGKQEP